MKGAKCLLKTIITFIFVFGLIVIVHEFGHFYFAKRAGIMVREFAIGMGPKLLSFHKNGTTYTWRLLPIGGYVRMAGLGEDTEDLQRGMSIMIETNDRGEVVRINTSKRNVFNGIPLEVSDFDLIDRLYIKGFVMGNEEDEQTYPVNHDATLIESDGTEIQIAPRDVQFDSAKLSKRMMTNFAGPMNNFILAVVLFMIVAFLQGGAPNLNTNRIGEVQSGSVAQKSGLKSGAEILSINQHEIRNWDDITQDISKAGQKPLTMKVRQDGQVKKLTMTPKMEEVDGQKRALVGISSYKETSIWSKIKYGFTATVDNSVTVFKALGNLITGFSLNKLGGPVAIFKMSETAASSGLITILSFTAMLSVNLGIMNLLPIPALDGGKIVLNIYEALRGKPMDPNKEGILTMIGFGCLMLLMILVTWNDIRRYFF